MEEGDKQAIIDRLKAEVAFLREQIRSAERGGGERRILTAGERSERQNERENELQNQLLDTQENYNSLSQRHAKLIAEMAKARDNEASENQHLEDSLGDSATERLNRSNSFAQAVEQVVLEYEKTIQSLEQSLSSTRTTLSTTETSLLEKESKCAYTETINTQLQARLQKLMDREASTENYLHDLEAKLDGHTSGEEKNATIILELRKEIARVRENEANCEDYISTLEERLAEADQDAELMQRRLTTTWPSLRTICVKQHGLKRIAIVDWDVHHGNGTEVRSSTQSRMSSHLSLGMRRGSIPSPIKSRRPAAGSGAGIGANLNLPCPIVQVELRRLRHGMRVRGLHWMPSSRSSSPWCLRVLMPGCAIRWEAWIGKMRPSRI